MLIVNTSLSNASLHNRLGSYQVVRVFWGGILVLAVYRRQAIAVTVYGRDEAWRSRRVAEFPAEGGNVLVEEELREAGFEIVTRDPDSAPIENVTANVSMG